MGLIQDNVPFLKLFECHVIDDVNEGLYIRNYFNNFWQVRCIDMGLNSWRERVKSFRMMYDFLHFDEIQEKFMTSSMTGCHDWKI